MNIKRGMKLIQVVNQALKNYVFFPAFMLKGFLIKQVKMTVYYGKELSLVIILQAHGQSIKKYKTDGNNYFIIKLSDIKEIKPLIKNIGFILKCKNAQNFVFFDPINTKNWLKWLTQPNKPVTFK